MTIKKQILLDCLLKTKSLIKQGWTRNVSMRKIGNKMHYCLVGAIFAGCKNNFDNVSAIMNVFKKANHIDHIPDWNDDGSRKKIQVIQALDKTIEYYDKKS